MKRTWRVASKRNQARRSILANHSLLLLAVKLLKTPSQANMESVHIALEAFQDYLASRAPAFHQSMCVPQIIRIDEPKRID